MKGSWYLVQPRRMMFGFKNATGTYQRRTNLVYGPSVRGEGGVSDDALIGDIVEASVDDSVTNLAKEEGHIDDLTKVLTRLVANTITLKWRRVCGAPRSCRCLATL